MGHIAYIGIGSNIGAKARHCRDAVLEILKADHHKLLAKSSFYRTKPLGYLYQDRFMNAVIKIETDLGPFDLLRTLKAIESEMGRLKTFRWGPRTIDLDLLFFDERKIETEELQVPHPLLHRRLFVLIPLVEIEPCLIHPILKKSVRELLEELGEDQGVEKLDLL